MVKTLRRTGIAMGDHTSIRSAVVHEPITMGRGSGVLSAPFR
jgi:hypothetical protein